MAWEDSARPRASDVGMAVACYHKESATVGTFTARWALGPEAAHEALR